MSLDYDTQQGLIRHFSQERLDRRTAAEIQGIAAAIAFDGAISDDEIRMLAGWLDAHAADADRWPLRDLVSMFRRFLSDGRIDEPERRELLDYLSAIAASAERSGTAADVVFESAPDLEFEHRAFAFTGVLRSMPRKQAQVEVEARGGTYHDGPRLDTDYLVVGDVGSDVWATSRYGRKIETVVERRASGMCSTRIVREVDFVRGVLAAPTRGCPPPSNRHAIVMQPISPTSRRAPRTAKAA